MHARKLEEIRRMELYQQQIAKELVERQKQLEAERLLNDTVIRMKNNINDQLEHMNEIERMRKNMELEQSIHQKRRELDEIERKLNEARVSERNMNEQENMFKEFENQQDAI